MHPLEGQLIDPALRLLLDRDHAEVLADRHHRLREFLEIADRSNLEGHQNSSGQWGGRSVRKIAEARSSEPGFSSMTRAASASCLKSNPPR